MTEFRNISNETTYANIGPFYRGSSVAAIQPTSTTWDTLIGAGKPIAALTESADGVARVDSVWTFAIDAIWRITVVMQAFAPAAGGSIGLRWRDNGPTTAIESVLQMQADATGDKGLITMSGLFQSVPTAGSATLELQYCVSAAFQSQGAITLDGEALALINVSMSTV